MGRKRKSKTGSVQPGILSSAILVLQLPLCRGGDRAPPLHKICEEETPSRARLFRKNAAGHNSAGFVESELNRIRAHATVRPELEHGRIPMAEDAVAFQKQYPIVLPDKYIQLLLHFGGGNSTSLSAYP